MADIKVLINGEETNSVTVDYGTEVNWSVSAEGYVTQSGSQEVTEDTTLDIVLVKEVIPEVTVTINADPSGSVITGTWYNGEEQNEFSGTDNVEFTCPVGSSVSYTVEHTGYKTKSDTVTVTEDTTINVTLEIEQYTFTINASLEG